MQGLQRKERLCYITPLLCAMQPKSITVDITLPKTGSWTGAQHLLLATIGELFGRVKDIFTLCVSSTSRQWLSVTRVNAASWVSISSAPSQAPVLAWIFFITTGLKVRNLLRPVLNLECHSKLVSILNNLNWNRNCFRLYKKPFVSVLSLLYRNR